MDLLEMFSKNEDGFEILDSSYDPEFVAKIKEREKGLKGDKLWMLTSMIYGEVYLRESEDHPQRILKMVPSKAFPADKGKPSGIFDNFAPCSTFKRSPSVILKNPL